MNKSLLIGIVFLFLISFVSALNYGEGVVFHPSSTYAYYNASENITGFNQSIITSTTLEFQEEDGDVTFSKTPTSTTFYNLHDVIYRFNDTGTGTLLENITVTTSSSDGKVIGSYFSPDGEFTTVMDEDNYTVTLAPIQGYVTPITFNQEITSSTEGLNRTIDIGRTTINISLYDRADSTSLNNTNVSIIIQGVGNFTTSTGNYILQDLVLTSGVYTIQAIATGYKTAQKSFTYDSQEKMSIDLYLLNLTETGVATLTTEVQNDFLRLVKNGQVSLLEYSPSTLSYFEVDSCLSNDEGQCKFLIELNTKTYIISASKIIDGVLYTATHSDEGEIFSTEVYDGEVVFTGELKRTLTLTTIENIRLESQYYLRWNSTESFNNVTNVSQVGVDFFTTDGSVVTVCVEYLERTSLGLVSLTGDTYCVASANGKILPDATFTLNRSKNYVAQVYLKDGSAKEPLTEYYYNSDGSFGELLDDNQLLVPVYIFIWIFIIGMGLLSKNVAISGYLGIFFSWVEPFLFPSLFMMEASVLKTVILGFLVYASRKKEDLQ